MSLRLTKAVLPRCGDKCIVFEQLRSCLFAAFLQSCTARLVKTFHLRTLPCGNYVQQLYMLVGCIRCRAIGDTPSADRIQFLFVNRPELSKYKLGRRHPGVSSNCANIARICRAAESTNCCPQRCVDTAHGSKKRVLPAGDTICCTQLFCALGVQAYPGMVHHVT